ncbi:Craniofacial development protein [Dirofilaria immitis]
MSGKEEEENGSEDDDEYVPSDPEENINDESNENSRSNDDDDDDDDDYDGDDDDNDNMVNGNSVTTLKGKKTNKSEETEDERQQRLKSLFEEFIGGNEAKPKSSTSQALPAFTADGKQVAMVINEIPKLTARAADDIFGNIPDNRDVPLKNRPESYGRKEKSSGMIRSEKRKASDRLKSAISALSKKSKMSVLEKTAQDWGAFKSETGIQEELTSHNRGKQGYVDRVEFLSRTDYRQFEKERDARNAARKTK